MPFMVIYRTSDGSSSFEQADAIDEAALFVERLRNKEGIDQIRIYRMEEIGFAFRPYYKVELGLTGVQSTPPLATASNAVVIERPAREPAADVDAPAAPSEAAADAGPDAVAEELAEVASPLPPPHDSDGEPAGANGRRGLFGR